MKTSIPPIRSEEPKRLDGTEKSPDLRASDSLASNGDSPLQSEDLSGQENLENDQPTLRYRGFQLDRFQAEAIQHLKNGRSVLVSAPTGTGKTIIADYVVDQAIQHNHEVIYTAPIKALSNQKYRDYTRLYSRDAVGLVTGDLVIRQDAQIRIMTTEILRNILLQGGRTHNLSHVIIDEVHFLDDEERGTVWEELLIYLPHEVKIVALSATLPNIDEFAQWLSQVRGERVEVVKEDQRAVPLNLMLANNDVGILSPPQFHRAYKKHLDDQERENRNQRDAPGGSVQDQDRGRHDRGQRGHDARGQGRPASGAYWRNRYGRGRRDDRGRGEMTRHLDMVRMVSPGYLPILYFVFSRKQTETFARELSRRTKQAFLPVSDRTTVRDALEKFDRENGEVLTTEHRDMYMRGIAFHHAGLHVSLKALVEELYERKLIRVLYCTSTFALGINMPARAVVFDGLRKYNGSAVVPLTVRQFMQKAGRAGRRGMDDVGYVVIRGDWHDYRQDRGHIQLYQQGDHERINSAFNLSFSSTINLLHRYSQEKIREILEKSFLNFRHQKALKSDERSIERMKQRVHSFSVQTDPLDKEQRSRYKRLNKQVQKAERRLERDRNFLWTRFLDKQGFLKSAGYLEDDLSFNAGAKALRHIQINEIFVTEVLLEGVFDEVDEDVLFGILTGMVQDLPRSVTIRGRLRGEWAQISKRLKVVYESAIVQDAAELMGQPVVLCPELMPFGQMWAEGNSLASLMLMFQSNIDVSGDLVGAFRRAKDLAGQLRAAYRDNEQMTTRLTQLIQKVSRDEVEVID